MLNAAQNNAAKNLNIEKLIKNNYGETDGEQWNAMPCHKYANTAKKNTFEINKQNIVQTNA